MPETLIDTAVKFHISLNVANLKRSVEFYRRCLASNPPSAGSGLRASSNRKNLRCAFVGAGSAPRAAISTTSDFDSPIPKPSLKPNVGSKRRVEDESRRRRRMLLRPTDEVLGARPGPNALGNLRPRGRHRTPRRRSVRGGFPPDGRFCGGSRSERIEMGAPLRRPHSRFDRRADASLDVVQLQGTFNRPVSAAERLDFLTEIRRKLRPGGEPSHPKPGRGSPAAARTAESAGPGRRRGSSADRTRDALRPSRTRASKAWR